MNKDRFFDEIKDILLLEDENINEKTPIEVDSMSSLLLIAFFDEHFSQTITQEKIKELKNVSDLMEIAGANNLK
ncbi:hypothetical protein [Mariniflexile sp.]|uniref:hypothetical protein n=1 Tax=Mariniflexile sp. TaxID=1979402 RepID=UPI00404896AC